jgi:hypothetical protein
VSIPKKDWPAATLGFLEGRREVNETAIAYEALRHPVYHPLNTDIMAWVHAALRGLGWSRRSGSPIWRKPAKA